MPALARAVQHIVGLVAMGEAKPNLVGAIYPRTFPRLKTHWFESFSTMTKGIKSGYVSIAGSESNGTPGSV